MTDLHHPITQQSFDIIDREIGPHGLGSEEYAVVRRVIHSTADFEFKSLVKFSPNVIQQAAIALRQKRPIITDVNMVKQGIKTMVRRTFGNPLIAAIDQISSPLPGKTRTESGLLACLDQYPNGVFVIGNAPTALLALCEQINRRSADRPINPGEDGPSLVIGAPVGFVAVEDAKAALAQTAVPQIRVEGRKGGSPVAAAILNALLVLALGIEHPN